MEPSSRGLQQALVTRAGLQEGCGEGRRRAQTLSSWSSPAAVSFISGLPVAPHIIRAMSIAWAQVCLPSLVLSVGLEYSSGARARAGQSDYCWPV